MKSYVKVYMDYFDLGIDSTWQCEVCGRQFRLDNGLEIHHAEGRLGDKLNDINNLVCVCRKCHDAIHQEKLSVSDVLYIHRNFMSGNRKQFYK